jgi:enolase
VILAGVEKAGLKAGKDVAIALDPATSEIYEDGAYVFKKSDGSRKSSEQMVAFWEDWVRQFPVWGIEDGLAEDDWAGWKLLTEKLGKKIQLVGDDLFVTNPGIIKRAISEKVGNASLIKLNQIGTLTETLEAIKLSQDAKYGAVISHRSGETPDDFISDLAVATRAGQIKTGAPCRGERVAKYNQLMRIEEELGSAAKYAGAAVYGR